MNLFWAEYRFRPLKVIAIAKGIDSSESNLISRDSLQEMIEFEKMFTGVTEYEMSYSPPGFELSAVRPDNGIELTFEDICQIIPKPERGWSEIFGGLG